MLNHITVMGRLTRDPELRYTTSGLPVVTFTIACDRDRKNPDGTKSVDFIDIVAWRQTAEYASKYFKKGRMAVIEGRLQFRDWVDKNGGKRRNAEINVDNIYFGDSKPQAGTYATENESGYTGDSGANMVELDDEENLPF